MVKYICLRKYYFEAHGHSAYHNMGRPYLEATRIKLIP